MLRCQKRRSQAVRTLISALAAGWPLAAGIFLAAGLSACSGADEVLARLTGGACELPECYQIELGRLYDCLDTLNLNASGAADALVCSADEVAVSFSPFNDDPTGLTSHPSRISISRGGEPCAALQFGTGTRTENVTGEERAFTFVEMGETLPGALRLEDYEDGSLVLRCEVEHVRSADARSSCGAQLLLPRFERTDDLSEVRLMLDGEDGQSEPAFTCSGAPKASP